MFFCNVHKHSTAIIICSFHLGLQYVFLIHWLCDGQEYNLQFTQYLKTRDKLEKHLFTNKNESAKQNWMIISKLQSEL